VCVCVWQSDAQHPARTQVSLERTYVFRNSKRTWTGVPIIAANMDTTGTFAMAAALARQYVCRSVLSVRGETLIVVWRSKVVTTVHKETSPEEWQGAVVGGGGRRAVLPGAE
jgi:IMP dehydrogenase/GMP reductase